MKQLSRILLLIFAFLTSSASFAVGVPAGTSITNNVTVTFTIGGSVGVAFDSDVFQVQEVIDVNVTWQNASNVIVAPGATQQVLTFLLTNTGNGVETFSLQLDNSVAIGDDFDPLNGNIYLDGNNNGVFDGVVTDPLYVPASNDPVLDANGVDSQVVFLLSDIPATVTSGQTGQSLLTANALTTGAANAAVGTNLNGLGDGGIDAVVGTTQASDNDNGVYEINLVPIDVNIVKSAQVVSDSNGCVTPPCQPLTGATIRYYLQVNISGVGVVNNLVITDPIPANTSYQLNSINLDGVALTDSGVDADAGSFSANTVTVNLGSISSVVTHLITFDVTIN